MTIEDLKTPLGVPSFDRLINGGIRPGISVLLIGSFGAGHRDFLRTAALIHGNWQAETDLFGMAYDQRGDDLHRPSGVRFFSIAESSSRMRRSLPPIGSTEWVEPALEHIEFMDFSDGFARLGPIYPSSSGGIQYRDARDPDMNEFRRFLQAFGDELFDGINDELIFWDAISDFSPVALKYMEWTDLFFITQTINHLIAASDTVLTACADIALLTRREEALLKRTFDIVLEFEWLEAGSQKSRAMTVTKFPEFWAETATEDRVTFEVKLDRGQYGISDVQKIPPSRL